jgi:hypothetical protein
MTRTFAFLLGCVLLTAGSVPVGAAGLSWKVLNPAAKGTEVLVGEGSARQMNAADNSGRTITLKTASF